ncbi:hypothetical protein ABIB62_004521 [Mucilaginibacter sp. UYP25]|uniref:HYC_CC_PP family protein n=1 Tax=unclassified Mucilaginibacter TaxID=2617802 RepID=UPI003391AA00
MKKITIVLLTAFYLLSATGVSASSYYCCGFLSSTTFSIGEIQGANTKVAAKTNDCCKTIKHSFKVKDNHYGPGFSTIVIHFVPVILPFSSLEPIEGTFEKSYTVLDNHAPPFGQHTSIYTLYCSYLI